MRCALLVGVLGLALMAWSVDAAQGGKKKMTLTKQWSGSVEDEALMKAAPQAITSAKGLEKIWKEWKIAGKDPEIDFTKELVIVTVTRGSKLSLSATLDDKGNLAPLGIATRDLGPGFRYVLGTVSREGVTTVNGKELPKE